MDSDIPPLYLLSLQDEIICIPVRPPSTPLLTHGLDDLLIQIPSCSTLRWTETVRKGNRRPGRRRVICPRIYSVYSRMTRQLRKNDSWKLASTGKEIREYADKFSLLTFFSDLPLAENKGGEKQTTFPTHHASNFTSALKLTLNCKSQKLSTDLHF